MEEDAIATIVEAWRRQRPDLDTSPMLVVGRILRLAQLMDEQLRPTFASAGLGPRDFDVLAALRRTDPPHSRSPGDLRESLMVTSGAITKQVDRLAAKGLVNRSMNPHDARGRTITLTPAGLTLVDELIVHHLNRQRSMVSALDPPQAEQLATALVSLAAQLEGGSHPRGAADGSSIVVC